MLARRSMSSQEARSAAQDHGYGPIPTYEQALAKHGGKDSLSEYERGYVDALYAYAVMRDGKLYVGAQVHTLGQAVDSFLTSERMHSGR